MEWDKSSTVSSALSFSKSDFNRESVLIEVIEVKGPALMRSHPRACTLQAAPRASNTKREGPSPALLGRTLIALIGSGMGVFELSTIGSEGDGEGVFKNDPLSSTPRSDREISHIKVTR